MDSRQGDSGSFRAGAICGLRSKTVRDIPRPNVRRSWRLLVGNSRTSAATVLDREPEGGGRSLSAAPERRGVT